MLRASKCSVMAGLFPAVSVRGKLFETLTFDSTGRTKARPSRAAPLKPCYLPRALSSKVLKNEFQGKLEQSWVSYFLWLAKGRVSRSAIHPIELGVIEEVEDLRPELQMHLFSNRGVFKDSHIPIVDRRVAAQSARSVAKRTQRAVGEISGIEDQAVGTRIVRLERAEHIGLSGTFKAKRAAFQLAIVAVVDQDREPTLERVDARDLPAIQRLTFEALELWNRQFPDVVEDEAMACIVERRGIGRIEIGRVQNLFEA